MHGRLKVKTTAEQEESKRLERQKKLKVYRDAMKLIIHMRKEEDFDENLLRATGAVLAGNPDIYTLWNIRRQIFLQFSSDKSSDDMQKFYDEELHFLEECLKHSPKSYGSWYQRAWVMDKVPTPNWTRELKLCGKFLEFDERNFHCWDYRRFVASRSDVTPEQELDFTTSKISTNISNYSSWFYRSKLLQKMPSKMAKRDHGGGSPLISPHFALNNESLAEELRLVKNAYFTDPDDQSSWMYQRWLLREVHPQVSMDVISFSHDLNAVLVLFSKPIMLVDGPYVVSVTVSESEISGEWMTPFGRLKLSPLWTLNLAETFNGGDISLRLLHSVDCISSCHLHVPRNCQASVTKRYTSRSAALRLTQDTDCLKVLQTELDSCLQLKEIEPDNKWVMLTVVYLMMSIDVLNFEKDITECLARLSALDPQRSAYYKDIGSKFTVERILLKSSDDGSILLAGMGIATLYHPSQMAFFQTIDLSANQLRLLTNFRHLQYVENLNLDDNHIDSLDGLELPLLLSSSVKRNLISSLDGLRSLSRCPRLVSLSLEGNQVCNNSRYLTSVQAIVPHLKTLDGLELKHLHSTAKR